MKETGWEGNKKKAGLNLRCPDTKADSDPPPSSGRPRRERARSIQRSEPPFFHAPAALETGRYIREVHHLTTAPPRDADRKRRAWQAMLQSAARLRIQRPARSVVKAPPAFWTERLRWIQGHWPNPPPLPLGPGAASASSRRLVRVGLFASACLRRLILRLLCVGFLASASWGRGGRLGSLGVAWRLTHRGRATARRRSRRGTD